MVMLLNGSHWSDPVTEQPILDSVEIWNLINLTEDAHPIHLHLVRFQILDRRPFDVFAYQQNRTIRYLGPATPPDPNEAGWKDTVRADPGLVTRIIARFEGFAGRYVWHCHLLEHEDNEMMRPYEVVTSASERVAAITAQEASWCIGGNIVRR
jgi:spore coat protein A